MGQRDLQVSVSLALRECRESRALREQPEQMGQQRTRVLPALRVRQAYRELPASREMMGPPDQQVSELQDLLEWLALPGQQVRPERMGQRRIRVLPVLQVRRD